MVMLHRTYVPFAVSRTSGIFVAYPFVVASCPRGWPGASERVRSGAVDFPICGRHPTEPGRHPTEPGRHPTGRGTEVCYRMQGSYRKQKCMLAENAIRSHTLTEF
jgi:hypothetical protein